MPSAAELSASCRRTRQRSSGIFRTSPGCARIGSIEGDNIELENVEAEIVRGKYVRIGHGCRIGTVEYGENLEAEHGTVGHSTQTGTK
ncbi:MAG: hypothetical protein ACLU3I_21860 [Acutalibacteraceae bacterium]